MNRDFTKNEKEKSQYQDNICSDEIIDPATSQPSEETSGLRKKGSFSFLELMTAGNIFPHLWTLFLSSGNNLCHVAVVSQQWERF